MRNNTSASNPNNYGGNAPVNIEGYVFTRNGADIRGSEVSVAGGIAGGMPTVWVFVISIKRGYNKLDTHL